MVEKEDASSSYSTLKFKFDSGALTKGETDRQLEFAPEYGINTVQTDQNLIVMQVIEEVVAKHGLAALLQAKPFVGINGLGKHNTWPNAALMPSNTGGMPARPDPPRRTSTRPPSPCPTPSARP